MIFKNEKQLEKYLLLKCKNAVAESEKKVYDIIDKCLNQYYNEFTPKAYIRTKKLLHSLVKTGIIKTGNGYEAMVYFDESMLDYDQGWIELQNGDFGYATWDGETVLRVAMTGDYGGKPHGGYAYGTPIWTESMKRLGNIFELVKEELIKQGIPIK